MRLGIALSEKDPWRFFKEIYDDLSKHYETTVFKHKSSQFPFFRERINRRIFQHDLQAFMQSNDVVFFEWASELLAAASHLPKMCRIVTRLHRYELYQWADKVNWDTVDKIILVSKAKEREFISRFPKQASKTVVVNGAISMDRFRPKSKLFSGDIGILCHLTPRKRVYDLVLTFFELIQKRNGLHLHIAGGHETAYGDYYRAIRHLVTELNLDDRITFYGNLQDPCDWYHKIDIFISNSYSEGLQVAPMEAMASGCYCLAHRWEGSEELLPGANLFYTDSELQEKILQYCEKLSSEKQNMRDKMREIACERFDINQTKSQIRGIVQQLGSSVASGKNQLQ